MKFSEMPYKRPGLEETNETLKQMLERFKSAETLDACLAAYKEIDGFLSHIFTMGAIGFIRNSLDTNDEFYASEKDYFDDFEPQIKPVVQELRKAMLETPFRAELEKLWGTLMFDNTEMALKTFSPEIVSDLQEENRLTTEYDKLIASAQIDFNGKTYTLAQLGPFHEDPDRNIRKASMEARANWFMQHAERLDSMFGELVQVRTRMAKKLGYENYIQLGYYRMQRNCYDGEMVEKFRKGVREHIVPVARRLKAEQAKRIGVDSVTVYDDPFEHPDGNAKPKGSVDDIFAHGKKMYHELSDETAEFIDFMLENELFDVLTRPGKSGGGYCATIPEFKSPFIFANFNGTSGDIDVLTHEAGHAFASYLARDIYPSDLQEYTYETAETHSMSMEFFTWPWMEGFFGADTEKYRYSHLASALTFIPYGTMVDDYQHRVYANPDMSPKERNDLWLELEGIYRPYLDLQGFPFYGEGRRWQAQSHIYERPFYYIDYCLAQAMALSFWAEDQKDHKSAWAKYRRFVGFAGTKTFTDLIADAGLPSPFEPETLSTTAKAASDWLNKSAFAAN